MIALDIETGGIDPQKNSILSIGAVHIESGDEFYIECRNYPDREVDEFALKVNGFTLEQVNDETKVLPHIAYNALVAWALKHGDKHMLVGENLPSFDVQFLLDAQKMSSSPWIFGYRHIDLHSVSYAKFGTSVKMDKTLELLGLPPEPKPHNALTGARVTRDAIKKLLNLE